MKPKLSNVSTSARALAAVARHPMEDLPQLVNGQIRGVDDLVGQRANRREHCRAPVRAPPPSGGPGASGCGRRVSLKRRSSAASLASRKISSGCSPRVACSRRHIARKLANEPALAHVDDHCDLLGVGVLAQRQVGQHRDERRRQVVDAVVAEIFERANRVRLARARQCRSRRGSRAAPVARRRGVGRRAAAARLYDARHSMPSVVEVVIAGRPRGCVRSRRSRSCASSRAASSRAALMPRVRSSWLRAATSTRMARLRPGRHRHPDERHAQPEQLVRTHRRVRGGRTRAADPSDRAARPTRPASTCASRRRRTDRGG